MVPIGGRPILWHIMKFYAAHGHKEFILCLGYKGEMIKDFFRNYLSASFDAYMKTKDEFDRRFRGLLETAAAAPQMWEKIIPGAEVVRELLTGGKKDEEK